MHKRALPTMEPMLCITNIKLPSKGEMMMGRKKVLGEDSANLRVRITKKQKERIIKLVNNGAYKDLSDFVRKAIDDRLGLEWIRN
jgi:hypothetical protein